jgi:hypothetical protein
MRAALFASTLALLVVPAASANSNRSVQGSGATAEFHCSSGAFTPANIQFSATKNKGGLFGSGFVFGGGANMFFSLNSGTINSGSYSLSGVVSQQNCVTAFSTLPASVTVSGACGTGVTIHYTDSYGDVGDFVGNVVCS